MLSQNLKSISKNMKLKRKNVPLKMDEEGAIRIRVKYFSRLDEFRRISVENIYPLRMPVKIIQQAPRPVFIYKHKIKALLSLLTIKTSPPPRKPI